MTDVHVHVYYIDEHTHKSVQDPIHIFMYMTEEFQLSQLYARHLWKLLGHTCEDAIEWYVVLADQSLLEVTIDIDISCGYKSLKI